MPASTPLYAIPYPIPGDRVADGPATFQALAARVEDRFGRHARAIVSSPGGLITNGVLTAMNTLGTIVGDTPLITGTTAALAIDTPGLYMVTARVAYGGPVTGRSFLQIAIPNGDVFRSSCPPPEDAAAVSANFMLTVAGSIVISAYQTSGVSRNVFGSVEVTRVARRG